MPCRRGGGSADGASLSVGAPLGESGGGLLVGDPEGYERRALGMGTSLYGGLCWGNLGWAYLLGLQDMAEGALEMECLSPWELCEGNLEGAPSRGP